MYCLMHLASELNARIEPTSMLLKSFGGHQLDTVGKCVLDTKTNEATGSTPLEYYVIRDNVRPLLGLESCLALKLITLNDIVEQIGLSIEEVQQKPTILDELTDVFEGLGCNISNTRKSVSSGYPNPEKWVEKTRRSRAFLTDFEVFGDLMKHSFEFLIWLLKPFIIPGEIQSKSLQNFMLIKIRYPNHRHGSDFLCFLFMNY